MITYRTTTYEQDYNTIEKLCAEWWPDSLFFQSYGIPYKIDKNFFDFANKTGALLYTIGYIDDEPISCYIGIKQPYPFNPDICVIIEVVWCIAKKYRGYKNLVSLLTEIERIAIEQNADLYSLAVSNEDIYQSLHTVLSKKGFVYMDHLFMKQLKRS